MSLETYEKLVSEAVEIYPDYAVDIRRVAEEQRLADEDQLDRFAWFLGVIVSYGRKQYKKKFQENGFVCVWTEENKKGDSFLADSDWAPFTQRQVAVFLGILIAGMAFCTWANLEGSEYALERVLGLIGLRR